MELKPVQELTHQQALSELYDHVHDDYCTNHDRLLHLLVDIVQKQNEMIDYLERRLEDTINSVYDLKDDVRAVERNR